MNAILACGNPLHPVEVCAAVAGVVGTITAIGWKTCVACVRNACQACLRGLRHHHDE